MTPKALRVVAVLNDPIMIPPGVREALIEIEEKGRETLARLARVIDNGHPIALVTELRDEVEREFSENEYSAFNRALYIPPALLANNGPVMRAVSEGVASLVQRANTALALQERSDQVRTELKRQFDDVSSVLGLTISGLLRDGRLHDADFARVRHSADVLSLRNRIAWFADQLAPIRSAFEARVPTPFDPAKMQAKLAAEVYPDELRAILASHLATRRRLAGTISSLTPVRETLARQQLGLVHTSGRALAGRESAIQLATELAAKVATRPRTIGHHYEDASLWQASVTEAWEHHEEQVRSPGWKPAIESSTDRRDATALCWCVVPLGEEWVALTRSVRTPFVVKVRDGDKLAADLDLRVQIDWPFDWIDPAVARHDTKGLWSGLETGCSAWYQAVINPRIDVVGESFQKTQSDDEVWFAKVKRTGVLESEIANAWDPEAGRPGRFRILHRRDDQPAETVTCSEPISDPTFALGFTTVIVRTALAGYDEAWMRTVEPATAERVEALEAECALFAAMESGHATSLHYLGRGKSPNKRSKGFLYGMPVITRFSDSQRLRQWMTKSINSRFAFVKAVADVMTAVLRAGYSLGLYHLDTIGFGVRATNERILVPTAIMLNAPLATRLGEPYRLRLPARELRRLRYSNLAYQGLAEVIQDGVIASEWTEKVAFTLFALDMLAATPLGGDVTAIAWEILPRRIQEASETAYSGWGSSARAVSQALLAPEQNRALDSFFRMINNRSQLGAREREENSEGEKLCSDD